MVQPHITHEASSQSPHRPQESPKPKVPFDIDNYLNPFIPRSPFYLLPTWISYFFGYRALRNPSAPPPKQRRHHTLIVYTSVVIGTFCGLTIIENVFLALPPLSGHAVPIIIASFGAAAILEYNSIESPLAQPRNLVFGHFFSAVVAVGITKLFEHLPPQRFEDLRWLAGALAVSASSVLMSMTKTVHPPAGATALLAATNDEIRFLGWWLLPLVLLASALMLTTAMITNNLAGRRYPVYWWTPVDLKALREERRKAKLEKKGLDVEKGSDSSSSSLPEGTKEDAISDEDTDTASHMDDFRKLSSLETRPTRTVSFSSASRVPHPVSHSRRHSRADDRRPNRKDLEDQEQSEQGDRIVITKSEIIVPEWLQLNDWEDEVLRILLERLRDA